MSLVADYSDSDSEHDDGDRDVESQAQSEGMPEVRIKLEPGVTDPVSNFFLTTDKDEDNNDNQCDTTTCKDAVKVEPEDKLHNPLSGASEKLPSIFEATSSRIGTSVFINPFEEAEQAKNQILEKHVKLTQAAPKKPANQPICWKFKKGKCHMGKNCRFFHDRGNVTLEENAQTINPSPGQASHRPVYHSSAYFDARRRPLEPELPDEDNYMASINKKRRFGVTDHLMPPQKAFESLQRQREVERPWTLPQD